VEKTAGLEEGAYLMSDPFQKYQQTGLGYQPPKPVQIEEDRDIPPKPSDPQGPSEFERELKRLINRHCQENVSGTPDFILAAYLQGALDAFNLAIQARARWRGESVELPALQKLREGKHTVPVVVYVNGRRNEIGEAEIKVWPGEAYNGALVEQVISVFESGSKEFIEASEGQVDAGMQKGLVSAEPMQELDQFGGIAGLEREEVDNGRGSEPESGSVTS
jgi:hypothetical protein